MSSTVTIGSDTYNVYSSLAAVNTYANGSLTATEWGDLTNDDKGRVLITVTRWIDGQCWQGVKSDPAQDFEFPRTLDDGTVVPITLADKAATMLAVLVAANPELADQSTGNLSTIQADGGTKRLKAGSVEIEYFRALNFFVYGSGAVSPFPKSVMSLLGPYLCATSEGVMFAGVTAYGTCAPSVVGVRDKNGFVHPI